MIDTKIYKGARTEADWLRYYAHNKERDLDKFDDCKFYDRIPSIGYAKVNTSLATRCPMFHVTGPCDVLLCNLDELTIVSGPRNHSKNVYTPLEFFLASKSIPQTIKDDLIQIILGIKS